MNDCNQTYYFLLFNGFRLGPRMRIGKMVESQVMDGREHSCLMMMLKL